jgi:hypothetical protein
MNRLGEKKLQTISSLMKHFFRRLKKTILKIYLVNVLVVDATTSTAAATAATATTATIHKPL